VVSNPDAMSDDAFRIRGDDRLWDLLGAIELTYHPVLAIALLAGIEAIVSPVPSLVFDPFSIAIGGGGGIPLTRFFAGIVLVDLLDDVMVAHATGWFGAPSTVEGSDE